MRKEREEKGERRKEKGERRKERREGKGGKEKRQIPI